MHISSVFLFVVVLQMFGGVVKLIFFSTFPTHTLSVCSACSMQPYVLLFATDFLQGPSRTARGPSYHKNLCTNIHFIKFKYSVMSKDLFLQAEDCCGDQADTSKVEQFQRRLNKKNE